MVDNILKFLTDFFIEPQGKVEKAGSSLELLDGEEVVRTLRPHIFAFYDMYLIWIWVIVLSLVFLNYGEVFVNYTFNPMELLDGYFGLFGASTDNPIINSLPDVADAGIKKVPVVGDVTSSVTDAVSPTVSVVQSYSAIGLWILSLVLSSLIISVLKIEFKWVVVMLGVGLLASLTSYYMGLLPVTTYFFAIIYCIFGMILVEVYRRAHIFYITNFRLVTEVDFLARKRNELTYDKINNVILDESIIGSIFNFGTLIPVTASGLGMGSDFSSVSVGGATQVKGGPFIGGQVTGGRSIQTPRTRSMYALYGVRNPDEIHKIITQYLHEYVNAPYLQKMTEQLQQLNEKLEGGNK